MNMNNKHGHKLDKTNLTHMKDGEDFAEYMGEPGN